jgi:hypothetical protein
MWRELRITLAIMIVVLIVFFLDLRQGQASG